MWETRDDGFTLVEVLIAVAILGLSVTVLLGGLGIAAKSSSANKGSADSRALLTTTAEQIEKAPYVGCPAPQATAYGTERALVTVPATDSSLDAAPRPVITNLSIWNGTGFVAMTDAAACAYDQDTTASSRMQRITFQQGSDTLTMVKRAP